MKLLDLTLNSPSANVALDEALLEEAEHGVLNEPVLRLWEPKQPFVVLGRSSPVNTEVDLARCKRHNIQVIRRCSGGASILTAPGCLMYAVVLDYDTYPQLRMLDKAHQFVMQKTQQAIDGLLVATELKGTCDLTINNRKVSGNSLRCKKDWLVYHGTMICAAMDQSLISTFLGTPRRQPDYRQHRTHEDFLTAIPVSTAELKQSLRQTWQCNSELETWPESRTDQLVSEKYSCDKWNFKI